MTDRLARSSAALLGLSVLFFTPAGAGIWDDPQNLEVLPDDISPQQLRATMRGFATGTGSRCYACHVGDDENDLRTYDFASDDKSSKQKAREMMLLVNEINFQLQEKLGSARSDLVMVECATCHRGRKKPEMLHDLLARSYRQAGFANAEKAYRELRARYFGSFAFDFRPAELMTVSDMLLAEDDIDGAIEFVNLNLEFYPDFVPAHILKARIFSSRGERDTARTSLEKAVELEPGHAGARRMLESLENSD